MANCYGCNGPNAHTKRYVNTGHSSSTYYGKKSVNFGTRRNYSYKFFCNACSLEMDERNKRSDLNLSITLLVLITIAILIYLFRTRF